MDPITSGPIPASAFFGLDTTQLSHGSGSSKLHEAAQDFEALMIDEMLKTAREAGSDGWLGSGDGAGNDSAMDLAETQLSQAFAGGGGIGLARLIEKQLSHSSNQNKSTGSSGLSTGSAK